MAQVLVRNLTARTLEALKRRARAHNRSLQQELKTILEEASRVVEVNHLAVADRIRESLKKKGIEFSDSAELIREDRER